MKIKKILSLMMAAVLTASCCSVAASAEQNETDASEKTYTYYFLAPDDWFDTSNGAVNEDVGCYWWQPGEAAAWPGTKMTPAFDIGDNVFKISGVPCEAATIIFNAYVDVANPIDQSLAPYAYQTLNINTEGYDENDVKELYDGCPVTDNFDGCIYVLDLLGDYSSGPWDTVTSFYGAWFKLDEYKNYPDYYGTYNIEKKKTSSTYYFAAPDNWFKTEAGAENTDIGAVLYKDPMDANSTEKPGHITEKMAPAPEIGENVFKIENVPYEYNYIQFYDYTDIKPHRVNGEAVYPSDAVSTRGYNARTTLSPYDPSMKCSSFDGMVYVLDMNYSYEYSRYGDAMVQDGAWFTVDNYKDYERYYGSYNNHDDSGTFTYYFLAPESWCANSKEPGQSGIVIGSKSVDGSEGVYLTRAPEIGENVYAAKDVPSTRDNFRFASWEDEYMGDSTRIISAKGYNGNCPYDNSVTTENFDGWIYVLDGTTDSFGDAFGAWFTVEDYRNHKDYYGTYGVDGQTPDEPADLHKDQRFTLCFLAPDSWNKQDAGANNDKVGCIIEKKTGETVEEYPGTEMTPAPEIGENVFKITGLVPDDFIITFTNFTVDLNNCERMASAVCSIEANDDGSCLYDGMVYVLDCTAANRSVDGSVNYPKGEWFTPDDYMTHDDFYGTYSSENRDDIPILVDIDGDGATTSADALEILRFSAGLSEYGERFMTDNADVDGDGSITSADALEVLRISADIV